MVGNDDLLVPKSLGKDFHSLLVVGSRDCETGNSIKSCVIKQGSQIVELIYV